MLHYFTLFLGDYVPSVIYATLPGSSYRIIAVFCYTRTRKSFLLGLHEKVNHIDALHS